MKMAITEKIRMAVSDKQKWQ